MAMQTFPNSIIKSVQRGQTVVSSGSPLNVTISSVNMAKATLNINGISGQTGTPGSTTTGWGGYLANSTTVTLWQDTGSTTLTINWEVIEYV